MKFAQEKLLHIDLETGGLDPNTNAITQLAAAIEIDGEVVGRFGSYIQPPPGLTITEEAIKITRINVNRLHEYPTEKDVFSAFLSFLACYINKYDKNDKAIMAGYNVKFDDEFLRVCCDRVGEKYFGSFKWADIYDSRGAAALFCRKVRHLLPNFKLETVGAFLLQESNEPTQIDAIIAEELSLPSATCHDARIDTEIHRQIFGLVRWGGDITSVLSAGEIEKRAARECLRVSNEELLNNNGTKA